ncbi:MAG TPA: DGQHR domain-containing protein [Puia sp.]|uniref:DGQHR domain-containing protein n=1 Tax=Puia sp. TaxID=2045100 RepID=UPI002CFCA99D|nr:DGQHR domain-containing protein [Puia sp.]HVU95299.1 DGQHR domain-containing protein [Puia sp.]
MAKKNISEIKKKRPIKSSAVSKSLSFDCLPIVQGNHILVVFKASAKSLWDIVEINQRDTDKNTGYQRALSESRVASVQRYIEKGNTIPISILIALGPASHLSKDRKSLSIPQIPNAGWVIDGQHRLAGAKEAANDIELAVVAILHPSEQEQIKQFVIINQEAKGVPRSLYYDLLKHLPPDKSETDLAKERAVDIANQLKKDENSPFYSKIVITSPKTSEISLNNFVRKVYPLLSKNGFFNTYTLIEQTKIIENYFSAFRNVFPQYFEFASPIFYKTLGFGGLMNSLPTIFQLTLKHYQGFTVADISKILRNIADFDFGEWNSGTGTQAEKQASDDLNAHLSRRLGDDTDDNSTTIRL